MATASCHKRHSQKRGCRGHEDYQPLATFAIFSDCHFNQVHGFGFLQAAEADTVLFVWNWVVLIDEAQDLVTLRQKVCYLLHFSVQV